jgi:tetratricopeptide (TPR) repeat protein/tRNA A-37 threonylcarbamoyl transferase component Bud32
VELETGGPKTATPGDPPPGTRIGPYVVENPVARGGMATVLAVIDTRNQQRVAMKLLLSVADTEESRTRFRREFRALSRLNHPNVLRVFEWGLYGDRPWFTMELVPGHDLRAEVDLLLALPPKERFARSANILEQIARALAYIHDRGLIHRDITPANVMVRPDGTATLMDFGVVKEMGAELTSVNELIGTVAFISPEQISGDEIDARADLYSLGAVLYLLLTGKRPFSAHTIHGFLEKHLHAAPRPPRELDPLVPEGLEAICLRLLAKKPEDRYASATHLLHVLGGSADDEDLDRDKWPPRAIGRMTLKARLRDALDALAAGKGGGALVLHGPLGQGKTRLLELVATYAARRGVRVAIGRCQPHDRPFGAFAGVYQALGSDPMLPILDDVFGAEEDGRVHERYPVVAAFRELVKRRAPCAILIDDLERADPATLEMLLYLIRNTRERADDPVLYVLAHESPLRRQLIDVPGLTQVELGPLDASEVEELVISVLDSEPASLALARRLYQESKGSPAFIADMLRGLIDDGLIVRKDHHLALTVDASEITRSRLPMPASLRQALQERLAPLSAQAIEVGRTLALARRRVDLDVLVEVAPLPEDQLMDALDELVDRQIVEEHRADDRDQVDLSHARFRDVLLEALPPEDKRARHQRMGEALEKFHRGRTAAVVEDLAWHFEQAGLAPKAYAYLFLTAQRHLNRSLFEESLVQLERALRMEPVARPYLLLDDADRRLAELVLARSQARYNLGQIDEAVESTRQAEQIARAVRDPRLQSRIAAELGVQLRHQGKIEPAEQALRQAIEKAEEAGDQSLIPTPQYQLGGILWSRGDLPGAEACWRQSLAIATRIGDERAQGYGYNGLGILAICRGQLAEARKHVEASATLFERLGMLGPLVIARVNLVELYLNTGMLRDASLLADKTIQQAQEVHHQAGVGLGLTWRAQVLLALGRTDEALRNAEEALRVQREIGAREDEVLAIATLIEVQLARKQWPAVLTAIHDIQPLLPHHDSEGIAPAVSAWHAIALAAHGRGGMAAAVLTGRPTPKTQWPHIQMKVDLAFGRALIRLDRRAEAIQPLERTLALAESNGYRLWQLYAQTELARVHPDEIVRGRYARVGAALARSLAANLDREDARRFVDQLPGAPPASA